MARSPPPAEDLAEFQQQLVETHYMPDTYTTDQQSFIRSGTNSGYITPDTNQMLELHGSPFLNPYINQYETGSGLSTVSFLTISQWRSFWLTEIQDAYGHPMYYQQPGQEYYPAPANQYPVSSGSVLCKRIKLTNS